MRTEDLLKIARSQQWSSEYVLQNGAARIIALLSWIAEYGSFRCGYFRYFSNADPLTDARYG